MSCHVTLAPGRRYFPVETEQDTGWGTNKIDDEMDKAAWMSILVLL